ncbi:abcF4 [Symbiodinium sp. CCMP2592]|nr:abcF4 [Symbiodinium sp. CCMP2592]
MADILVPQTPPRKVMKPRRAADLTGLWEAWEENRQLRKQSRKKGSLLEWEHPSKVGLINRRSLMLNWKVILPLLEIYCPKNEPKTVPVQSLKQHVRRFFEEIEVTPKNGLCHCTSHSLKMFVSYIIRRHDGSVRKDHRLKAIFDEVAKSWPPKARSRRTLVEEAENPDDDECEKEGQEEEEEEELQLTEDEVEEDSQAAEVDDYLAEAMGLVPGSPQPPSAYVGTVAYELSNEGEPVPYRPALLDGNEGEAGAGTDLVKRLAELEHLASNEGQQIAHRRAALSGQMAIQRWHSLQHMDSQRTIAWPERLDDGHEQDAFADPPATSEAVGGFVRFRRDGETRCKKGSRRSGQTMIPMKRPAAKSATKGGGQRGWPKGKAKARAKPLEKGEDEEPKPKPAKQGKQGDDEEPKPKPAKRGKQGKQGDDEEEPKPKPAKRGKQGDDEEPKPAKKGKRGDDEEPKPAKKGKRGDDEPKPKPATKCKQGDDEPKPKPAKKGKQGDDEPKPKPAKKGKQGDEPVPKPAKKGKQGDDDEPLPKPAKKGNEPKPPLKKTFARRFEPPTEGDPKCLWTSIRDAFNAVIRQHFRFPVKHEDLFWKHCRPILIQEEQPHFRSKAQQVAFEWLEMQRANGALDNLDN